MTWTRRNRWQTGWVVLPGTRAYPGDRQHRPHPGRPGSTVCDRVINKRPVSPVMVYGVELCMRCITMAGHR